MAESSNGDKTEKPSEQKLRKAREEGQVARSKDAVMAVGVLLAFKLLLWIVPASLQDFRQLFALALAPSDLQTETLNADLFFQVLCLIAQMLAPLLVLPLAGLVASLLPGGWVFVPGNWAPKASRLSPAANLGRLFSGKHASDFALSLLKVAALLAVLWMVARGSLRDFVALQALSLDAALLRGADLVMSGLMALATVFVLIGLVDAPLQQFFFLRGQRMSRQDQKDEHKQNEGRPEVRQRMHQLQRALSQRSIRAAVPTADVVVVNPEHYAVALRYDEARAHAPYVVAKGVDEMAFYIREVAGQHGVQVLSLPPLARAIYNSSQVQQQIPAVLYEAVAQVLSHVMQLKAFQAGRRRKPPVLPTALPVPTELSDPRP